MDNILIEVEDAVITITLNDPDRLNALGETMARELREAVRYAADPQQQFRCLVLTGAGRGFCSGGSVGMMSGDERDSGQLDRVTLGTHHHHVLKLLRNLPYPVLTAINGPAAGLGFSFALAGDLIVAKQSAYFLAAFNRIGVSSDGGLSWVLPRLVGGARARELLLLGEKLTAEQALEWGLINRVYQDDEFESQVEKLARQLARGPTVALGATRRLIWDSWDLSFEQHLDREEQVQPGTFATEDAKEGIRAMLEKRAADFRGS